MRLSGYAAVFNSPTRIGGMLPFTEIVRPGAFADTLRKPRDVKLLHHHSWQTVLASLGNNTLQLNEDTRGLHITADLADTTEARDLFTLVKRRDIEGMSFSFTVDSDLDEVWREGNKGEVVREIKRATLWEVTVTPRPAYKQTSVNVLDRSVDSDTSDTVVDLTTRRHNFQHARKRLMRLKLAEANVKYNGGRT